MYGITWPTTTFTHSNRVDTAMMIATDWGCPVHVGFYHVAWTYDYVRDVDILFTVCGEKITLGAFLGR